MNFWPPDFKKIFLTLVIAIAPITIASVNPESTLITGVLSPITGPLQNFFYSFSSGVRGSTQLYFNLVDIRIENRQLAQENLRFKAKLSLLTEIQLENLRLNKALSFKATKRTKLLAAKVIGISLVAKAQTMTINRGRKHGLKKYLAAIHTGGVVGYVTHVEENTAHILALTDPQAVIDTLVQRTRTRGLTEGRGYNKCQFSYFASDDSDILVGDLLVTSGMSTIFPKGLPVGQVTQIEKKQFELKQNIKVEPFLNLQKIEELFIVLPSVSSEDA